MNARIEVLSDHPGDAAAYIARLLPMTGPVVITGGTTARAVYENLDSRAWDNLDVFFSDERCVPPDDDDSNHKMATESFLGRSKANVHRMEGELEPDEGAARYHDVVAPIVTDTYELMLLGMGADCHICAMFPSSPALIADANCVAVDRPDGLKGLTLTPAVVLSARRILVPVVGKGKAEAVRRAVEGTETVEACPARLLAAHPDVTFLLDEGAASLL